MDDRGVARVLCLHPRTAIAVTHRGLGDGIAGHLRSTFNAERYRLAEFEYVQDNNFLR